MRLPVKFGDNQRTFATTYEHLTVWEFHRLKDWADYGDNDMLLLYSILLAIDPKMIREIKRSQLDRVVGRHLTFLENKWDMTRIKTPPTIEIQSKILAVPANIDLISLGQYIGLDQYINELEKKPTNTVFDLERMQAVIMIVFWKDLFIDESFSLEKLKARKSLINSCNYKDCWAVEIFFWKAISKSRRKEKSSFRAMWTEMLNKLTQNNYRSSANLRRLTL